jgi:hypothetical protein
VIGAMLAKWREGYEVVYGVRRNRSTDSLPKRLTADLYYRAHNYLSDDKIPEHAGDFRLLDRSVVEVIRSMPERNRFMKGLFAWGGFRQAAVEYDRSPRTVGTTKFRYWKLWTLALDGITSASTMPLRIWSYVGVLIAFLALIYAAAVIIRTTLFGIDVPGYPSLHGSGPVLRRVLISSRWACSANMSAASSSKPSSARSTSSASASASMPNRPGTRLMERAVFDRMAELDSRIGGSVARRRILADLIAREVPLPPTPVFLEIGCGTGHNFEMLGRFGRSTRSR